MCDFITRFHARGGTIVTGTDDEHPGSALTDEIRLLRALARRRHPRGDGCGGRCSAAEGHRDIGAMLQFARRRGAVATAAFRTT
jgi:hypothetical protein